MKKEDLLNVDFLKQFKNSKTFGVFADKFYNRGVEKILEDKLDGYLDYDKNEQSYSTNARNGYGIKTIKTESVKAETKVSRYRDDTSFESVIVSERSQLTHGIENLIVSLYAKGMSNVDIEEQLYEIYDFQVSASTISNITNDIAVWQNRPLESVYLIVWMYGIVFKVRENSKIINKTIYVAVGLKRSGKKEFLGLWFGKSNSVNFWMSVLMDIKARGVQDILITATDNLNGFSDAIKNVFPESKMQICVVHQIRKASRYVAWKDKWAFTRDMKAIYESPTKQAAEAALKDFAKLWGRKYSYAIKIWQNNWDDLNVFFEFPIEIRKIIYTTNIIGNLNGKIRKYTKNKLYFSTYEDVTRFVYLVMRESAKKWSIPIRNWKIILTQFLTIFNKRVQVRKICKQ